MIYQMRQVITMKFEIPSKVETIIHTLEAAGFEAYAVGGCVRDALLGRTPNDWDITTSATPEQVKALFHRTVDTGIAHGTVTVLLDKDGFEVTTYRVDGEYEDGRHPKEVTFTASLEEDLKRRDFTINAMAYNPEKGLVDLFGGQEGPGEKSDPLRGGSPGAFYRGCSANHACSPFFCPARLFPGGKYKKWAGSSGSESEACERGTNPGGAGEASCFSTSELPADRL